MKRNKILLISLLAIFCLSIGAVCAADNDNSVLSENQNDSQDNLLIEEDLNQNNNLSNSNQMELIEEDVDNENSSSLKRTPKNYIYMRDIVAAAPAFKKYIKDHGKLPDTVVVGGKTFSAPSFVRYMAFAVAHFKTLESRAIEYIYTFYVKPHKIYPAHVYCSQFDEYRILAKQVLFTDMFHLKTPLFVYNKQGRFYISYEVYAYGFACILDYVVNHNNTYPDKMLFTSQPFFDGGSQNHTNSSGHHDYEDYEDYYKSTNSYDNKNSSSLPDAGNPLLVLLLTLVMIPILRIKK